MVKLPILTLPYPDSTTRESIASVTGNAIVAWTYATYDGALLFCGDAETVARAYGVLDRVQFGDSAQGAPITWLAMDSIYCNTQGAQIVKKCNSRFTILPFFNED